MKRHLFRFLLAAVVVCSLSAFIPSALASDEMPNPGIGAMAPDFPPGEFSDGGDYHLSDFRGKIVVLLFYESSCPTCMAAVPGRNALIQKFADKPVKFIAVSPHNGLDEAKSYIDQTGLITPVFADSLNIMETLYDEHISLDNTLQVRIIGPTGKIISYDFTSGAINEAIKHAKWKYKDAGYDPKLNPAIELLEWNQYQPGVHLLQPLRHSGDKTVAASAEKLYQAVRSQGAKWSSTADSAAKSDPVKAYDLYTKIATVFAGDDPAKSAAASAEALTSDPKVKAELSARKMYAQLEDAIPRATADQKGQIIDFCRGIAQKYPGTPSAQNAQHIAEILKKAPNPQ